MSKIEQLIQQLCPEGVEYKKLHELTTWDKRFNGVDKSMQPKTISYPYLLAKDLKSLEVENGDVRLLETGISKDLKWTTEEVAGDYVCEGEIVAIPWGGTPNVKYYKGKFVTADNRIATANDKSILSNKYLYYWMANNIDTIAKLYRGAGIQHPSMAGVLNLSIPLPPLPVQQEIVRILDTFTELEAELETELEAELEARKKQYEYYRDTLLSFEHDDPEVEWKRLGEVCEMRNGYTPSKSKPEYWEDGNIPWFRMEDIRTNGRILSDSILHITTEGVKGKGLFPANSIILATTATIGEHALIIVDSLANQRFTNLSIRKSLESEIDIKFFFYYMFIVDEWCKNNTNPGTFASVDTKKLANVLIPLPPLSVQQEIVRILDKFEALTSDLQSGLPAEIEARRKQYEYYRDRLLTFKVKN